MQNNVRTIRCDHCADGHWTWEDAFKCRKRAEEAEKRERQRAERESWFRYLVQRKEPCP